MLVNKSSIFTKAIEGVTIANMEINVLVQLGEENVSLENDESYNLSITKSGANLVSVTVEAVCFQGARHAVETLFQLMDWDGDQGTYLVVDDVQITDSPFYPHRGLLIDTSRNFISVGKIKEAIDSLSYSKMSVLHLHLTDSHSFPIEVDFNPNFTNYGAYRADMIYTRDDLRELERYATDRGILIIPEVDTPGHIGAGWQAVDPTYAICMNDCAQYPCGQINPAAEGVYDVLENIYRELVEVFGSGYFHFGGDEVNLGCWKADDLVQAWLADHGYENEDWNVIRLWHVFLDKALARLDKVSTGPLKCVCVDQFAH
eukprot:TRINITY_DN27859_c0_g1_i1.p1 TRINITY_DN27859_c0_g1~~TRINITY_DN27859_c0_g1_i1.p1  ORF type:complete len:316 (+),score=75.20 TRINITY_DN27859_c0_g1_i1:262-1209(+)